MRVLAWNIRWGGQQRTTQIVEAICAHAPTVIVISEYQPVNSAPIIDALNEGGWSHCVATSPPSRRGGLAVLSKSPLEERPLPAGINDFARHYLAVAVPQYNLEVRAIYGPLHNDPYERFWTELLKALRSESAADVLVVGDFNSGSSTTDSPSSEVFCAKFFDQLPETGYVDLWRAEAGAEAREHTWQGPKNPYRLDHAFGSASLASRVRACTYSHKEKDSRISDHSILIVDIVERAV